ncbi:hypothetical protein V2K77_14845 [Pseudomonas alliivorans]|nr:hypothetical protein [Pseudomonas alliivorans]MEE4711250.1 hypothetical protein [Pseudomonas alliivorans]MEE4727081.1 hypothetical protein [Pseudomonas alliivorans]MEE4768815.1 hypothetical protein [Pseudomonas alliivorans]MEE5152143.1 hypothetical protein [Pseudomonas alliivorans]
MGNIGQGKIVNWMQPQTLAKHLIPLLEEYDVKWRGHGMIYVNHEPYNINTAHKIITDLSVKFGVSANLVRARLIELELLKDVRHFLSLQDKAKRVFIETPSRGDDSSDEDSSESENEYPDA